MAKLSVAVALLIAATVPPSTSASARGRPPPPVPSEEHCFDDQGYTRCFFDTYSECASNLKPLRRHQAIVFAACSQNTVPGYEYEGKYELMYLL